MPQSQNQRREADCRTFVASFRSRSLDSRCSLAFILSLVSPKRKYCIHGPNHGSCAFLVPFHLADALSAALTYSPEVKNAGPSPLVRWAPRHPFSSLPLRSLSYPTPPMSQTERRPVDVEMGDQTGTFTASQPRPHQPCHLYRRGLRQLASFNIESAFASARGLQLWQWLWTALFYLFKHCGERR